MKGIVLAFISVKGGVGKTTLALESAASLVNDFGKKVLLVDANFSAPNIGLYLDLTKQIGEHDATLHDALMGVGMPNAVYEAHGIDVVPASMEYDHEVDPYVLSKALNKMRYRYDFIILDSSPHYSEMLPVVAAADKIFVVTTPDDVTLTTSLKAARMARRRQTPIMGMIVNKIRSPRHEMNLDEIEEQGEMPVLARIKDSKNVVKSVYHKTPMVIHNSNDCVSQEIRRFCSALVGEPEELKGFFHRILPFKNLLGKEAINREVVRKEFYESEL